MVVTRVRAGIARTGRVKKIVHDRGFGSITADDGRDYFFHMSGLDPSLDFDRLDGGESVSFTVESSPKGPRAIDIRRTSPSNW
jgi:CspA family cold shock protein